jgi:hypothetical protein
MIGSFKLPSAVKFSFLAKNICEDEIQTPLALAVPFFENHKISKG